MRMLRALLLSSMALLAAVALLAAPAAAEKELQPVVLSAGLPAQHMYPTLTASDDTLHAVWVGGQVGWNKPMDIWYSRSLDNGENWDQPLRLNTGAASVLYQQQKPALVAKGDDVYVFWKQRVELMRFMLAASHDGGLTWSDESEALACPGERACEFPAAAIDGQGALHLVYQQANASHETRFSSLKQLHGISSSDGGGNWSEPVVLNPFDRGNRQREPELGYPCECCAPGIAGGPDGGIHLVYRNVSFWPGNDTWFQTMEYLRWDGASQPLAGLRVTPFWATGGVVCPESGPDIVVQPDGSLLLAWSHNGSASYATLRDGGLSPPTVLGAGFRPMLQPGESVTAAWMAGGSASGNISFSVGGEGGMLALPGMQIEPDIAGGVTIFRTDASGEWEIAALPLPAGGGSPGGEPPVKPPGTVAAVGEPAPGFTLVDTAGEIFSLEDYRGQVIVVEMMATWCSICAATAADTLAPLQAQIDNGTLEGVAIVSVGADRLETNTILAELADAGGYGWRHAIDTDGATIAENYEAMPVPRLAVIAPNGNVAFLHRGYISLADLQLQVVAAQDTDESKEPQAGEPLDEGGSIPALPLAGVATLLAVAARWRRPL